MVDDDSRLRRKREPTEGKANNAIVLSNKESTSDPPTSRNKDADEVQWPAWGATLLRFYTTLSRVSPVLTVRGPSPRREGQPPLEPASLITLGGEGDQGSRS